LGNIAQSYSYLRKWKEVESTARRALTIDPHEATSMGMWLLSCLNQNGNEQEALRVLATFPSDDLLVPNGGTLTLVIGRRAETFVLSRNFDAALKTWETSRNAAYDERQRLSATTAIRVLAGDVTGARADADKVRPVLEARLLDHPGEARSMRALSWIYLALERNDDAIRIAQQLLELVPPEKDAPLGSGNLASLAEVQARTGATSDAVANLRRLLSIPAGETVSIARLKIDPVWDPIRNDPGFQQLVAGKEHVGP
jgi:tetratricopeptide (TPR) repeat protein